MPFCLHFSTDNAAFRDAKEDGTAAAMQGECARILREIARAIENGHESGSVRDINGNRIGEWSL